MDIFRIRISAANSFCSPIQSDTLFGSFCWALRYIKGENILKDFINDCVEGKPPVVFSNAFPAGYMPKPLMGENKKRWADDLSKAEKRKKYTDLKRLKKIEFISVNSFNEMVLGRGHSGKGIKTKHSVLQTVTHGNLVNRHTGTVGSEDEKEAGLFERHEFFPIRDFEIYAGVEKGWQEVFANIVTHQCRLGIGADRSAGKGIFEAKNIEKYNGFSMPEDPDAVVMISNYIPRADDPSDGNYNTIVKYGKLGMEYASSEMPFKKPLIMITPGAVFRTRDIRKIYGRAVSNVSGIDKGIIHCGFSLAIPMTVSDISNEKGGAHSA